MRRDSKRTSAAGRFPSASLLLSFLALTVFLIPGADELFEFSRRSLTHGEIWRLVTCHWTHWSAEHLLWDVLAFAVLAALCEAQLGRRLLLVCLVTATLAISVAVWLFLPSMEIYRGLSGLDSTLFVLIAVFHARHLFRPTDPKRGPELPTRRSSALRAVPLEPLMWAGALGLFVCKVLYEALSGTALFVESGGTGVVVVPLAHLVGGSIGALLALTSSIATADRVTGLLTRDDGRRTGGRSAHRDRIEAAAIDGQIE
jgi:rhomboid family GlyGly-CTERM serine protease